MPEVTLGLTLCSIACMAWVFPWQAFALGSVSGERLVFFRTTGRFSPNLTLNLGLRYEYDEPWIEQNNKTANVDLTDANFDLCGSCTGGRARGVGGLLKQRLLSAELPADHAPVRVRLSAVAATW